MKLPLQELKTVCLFSRMYLEFSILITAHPSFSLIIYTIFLIHTCFFSTCASNIRVNFQEKVFFILELFLGEVATYSYIILQLKY